MNNKINNNIIEIVDLLNKYANTHYKPSTKGTQTLIKARIKEGYTISDFETVILKKVKEWKNTEFEQYLRPQTLFGNKFECYLNSSVKGGKQRDGSEYENL